MEKFEKNIKDAVQNYEVPYSADAWQSLNKAMGPSKATILKWITGSAAFLVFAIVGYNYFNSETEIIEDDFVVNIIDNAKSKAFIAKVENSETINHSNTANADKTEVKNTISEEVVTTEHDTKINHLDFISPINEPTPGTIDIIEDEIKFDDISNVIESKNDNTDYSTTLFVADFKVSKSSICLNENVTFTPNVPKQKAIYEWHLSDGTIKVANFLNHTFQNPGNYSVELVLKDLKTKKIINTSKASEIQVLELPESVFSFEHLRSSIIPETHFSALNSKNNTIEWEIVGFSKTNQLDFNYSFKRKGNFKINLTTTNENGCSQTKSEVIRIENDFNLLAPTAFSPNGDNLNDYFIPKALPLLDLQFTLNIYDRQGKLIFQTNDSNNPWDGRYKKDGVPAPEGIYVWVCELIHKDGKPEIYQSQIIITK